MTTINVMWIWPWSSTKKNYFDKNNDFDGIVQLGNWKNSVKEIQAQIKTQPKNHKLEILVQI
jgi:hypothetical protein